MGDEQKRKTYDVMGMTSDDQKQYGADPFSGGAAGYGNFWKNANTQGFDENINVDFESFFNMGMGRNEPDKGADILLSVEIPFMDAIFGAKKELAFTKKALCKACNGSRCKEGTKPTKCATCGGKGTINYRQGPMTVQMTCKNCGGQGTQIKNPCTACHATGIGNVQVKEEIIIPRGINSGQNLRMSGKVSN